MGFTLLALGIAIVLFFVMFGLEVYGFRYGRARAQRRPENGRHGLGSVEAAVYGLLGLLVAFSFSGAASRFEHRREQIVTEANAVGTAYLRLDVLPRDLQPSIREKFRDYLDARLAVYSKLPDVDAAKSELARATALQGEIWKEAIAAAHTAGMPASQLLLPALNEMFDTANARTAAAYAHPPAILFLVLVALALISAYLVGDGMSENETASRLHMVTYAAVMAVVVYVVIDLEFPRFGLIRLSGADRFLAEVRQAMQ